MPFTVGPFEIVLFLMVIGGAAVLVIRRQSGDHATRGRLSGDLGGSAEARSLDDLVQQGWRIESESADYVFLVKGQRVNHLLHFFVGLLTLGLWWIAWVIMAVSGGEERMTLGKPKT